MRSLLGRSVAAAVIGILIALVVVGAGVDVLASRELHRTLDRELRQRAVEVAQLTATAPALLTAPGALDFPLGGTESSVEVLDRRGRLMARSLSLGGRRLPIRTLALHTIASGSPSYSALTVDGERMRVYAAPLADSGGAAAGGAVVVAASERAMARTLGDLHLFVVFGALAGAALAALGVFLLLRRALDPVGRLADAAAEVERTGDPRRRLPLPDADDEVGRLAETLNAMLASLERSRDLERRFLADASHELRTPLTALRGNIAYAVRHGASPGILEELEHDVERVARLADDLLTLSREEAGDGVDEIVHLEDLVGRVAADHTTAIIARADPVAVRGDWAAIERALANLVENAEVHGPPGGRIALTVEQVGERAHLTVTDEGPGLRAEETRLAFRRFWRRTGATPGSGLGLAIVRATAERHGGTAYAESARFTIDLPAFREPSGFLGTTEAEQSKGTP
jgi:signal transduction histidine kinase